MSHSAGKKKYGFAGPGHDSRQMAVYLALSFFAHVLFFIVSIWLVQFEMYSPVTEVVQVDLVSFAPGEPGGGDQSFEEPVSAPETVQQEGAPDADSAVVVPEKQPAPEVMEKPAEPEPLPMVKPDISLKAKPKNLQELMAEQSNKLSEKKEKKPESKPKPKPEPKPEPDPREALEKARQKLADEKKAEKNEQLARAMERLAREVKQKNTDTRSLSDGDNSGPSVGSGSAAGAGRKGGTAIDRYKMVLQSAIEQNWVFNEILAGMDQNIEVRMLIKILKNGEIRDIVYETRSGNRYLDQSAKRALQKASPLPALPPGMASYDVVVIFTPKGLK
ncbi:MAG TPA: TonB family protein [Desulfotignum sp.]|nr:TonB family protein [Desulfotignum sp.]